LTEIAELDTKTDLHGWTLQDSSGHCRTKLYNAGM